MFGKVKPVSCPALESQRNFRLGRSWFLSIEEVWDGPCHSHDTHNSRKDIPQSKRCMCTQGWESSSLIQCSCLMGRLTQGVGSYLSCQFIWLKKCIPASLERCCRWETLTENKAQRVWFSRSHYCHVRSLENHRLQKQTGLTSTTDVLPWWRVLFMCRAKSVMGLSFSCLELMTEPSSTNDWANQQSVKCILSAEGDFNTRPVDSH